MGRNKHKKGSSATKTAKYSRLALTGEARKKKNIAKMIELNPNFNPEKKVDYTPRSRRKQREDIR